MSIIDPNEIKRLDDSWLTDDIDPQETREWADALEAVVRHGGPERGMFLLKRLEEQAQQIGVVAHVPPYSAYQNTIPLNQQGPYPGDLALEQRISAIIRWNALAMVVRANRAMMWAVSGGRENTWNVLRAVRAPTLFMWGEQDKMVPPHIGTRAIAEVANSHYVELEDCGHNPQTEKPEEFAAIVLEFARTMAR